MNFKIWLQENYKDLLKQYKKILDVPQNPIHHPEGSALIHSKLVRKAIPNAIQELHHLKNYTTAIDELDLNVSPNEMQILTLAAYLHDIGKSSATTYDDDKIKSIGHHEPEHYLPPIQQLEKIAPPNILNLYQNNKKLIHFLIENHMHFAAGGFPKPFIKTYFHNGKIKNVTEIKLLLILMWADKMGRYNYDLQDNIKKLIDAAEKSKKYYHNLQTKSKPFTGTPIELVNMLKQKGLNTNAIIQAAKNKFPELSTDDIVKMLG